MYNACMCAYVRLSASVCARIYVYVYLPLCVFICLSVCGSRPSPSRTRSCHRTCIYRSAEASTLQDTHRQSQHNTDRNNRTSTHPHLHTFDKMYIGCISTQRDPQTPMIPESTLKLCIRLPLMLALRPRGAAAGFSVSGATLSAGSDSRFSHLNTNKSQ